MSFHRNRHALIVDPPPLTHHHHHHYRFINNNNDYDLSRFWRKQNRDLSFVDLDERSAPPPPLKRGSLDLSSSSSRIEEVSSIRVQDSGFMSRDEIERWSPSKKDGIDAMLESHLRHSYCSSCCSLKKIAVDGRRQLHFNPKNARSGLNFQCVVIMI